MICLDYAIVAPHNPRLSNIKQKKDFWEASDYKVDMEIQLSFTFGCYIDELELSFENIDHVKMIFSGEDLKTVKELDYEWYGKNQTFLKK